MGVGAHPPVGVHVSCSVSAVIDPPLGATPPQVLLANSPLCLQSVLVMEYYCGVRRPIYSIYAGYYYLRR